MHTVALRLKKNNGRDLQRFNSNGSLIMSSNFDYNLSLVRRDSSVSREKKKKKETLVYDIRNSQAVLDNASKSVFKDLLNQKQPQQQNLSSKKGTKNKRKEEKPLMQHEILR